MDDIVKQALKKWPNVPHCYGWLALDARGDWYMRDDRTQAAGPFPQVKGSRILHEKLREFIQRNYANDEAGCWFFQNGPQRVYVTLAYTPLVVHYEGEELIDHCGRPFVVRAAYLDDEGSVLMAGERGIALLDDRDLGRFADSDVSLHRITRAEIPARFGFVADPKPA